ncbi:MAG: hypothetical protein IJO72_04960 [Oscillospiraceae bacterium]|nr:hypothetical protein [Oscillospiraceae bacterium]
MKRFPKLIVTLLLLAMVIGIFSAIPVSAASDYEALRLKRAMLEVGHYTSKSCDGAIEKHSANKNYEEEVGCLVDNDNNGGYWSKPYKFSALVDNGGSTVPVILIDLSSFNEGAGVAVSAFDLRLRSSFDCRPLHVVLQATLSANSNEWTTVADKKFTIADWDINPRQRIEFNEVTAFKFRILAYDIAEANPAEDEYNDYIVCKGDETRFTLSEIDLLTAKEGDSSTGNGGTSGGNTTPTTATRPPLNRPTNPIGGQTTTTAPTKAPTQPATKAPTQPATSGQTATKAPTQPATSGQTTTVAPTQPATQTGTVAPTDPTGTVDVTEPTGTVDPSAPTDPTETVDPSAPTDEPTQAPTDEATQAPTAEATQPEATDPTTDTDADQTPDNTWIIIVAIVAAAAIAGGAIFFIIKKKRG